LVYFVLIIENARSKKQKKKKLKLCSKHFNADLITKTAVL